MKIVNQILVLLVSCALIFIAGPVCKKNAASGIINRQALLQFPYDTLVKYGWYYYANYDTSYNAMDTLHNSAGWPQIPYYKMMPVLEQDACVLSTYYYFDKSGSLISLDCNGVKKTVATWQVYQDSTNLNGDLYINSFPLLVITSPSTACYTPFTDTLAPNRSMPIFFTMIDSSQMSVSVNESLMGWGNEVSVIIINNLMRHR